MIQFPDIKPYIFKFDIGSFPLEIRYYGLLYLISFWLGYVFVRKNLHYRGIVLSKEKYSDLIFYIALGVILGGRVGYIFFYSLPEFIGNPLTLFRVWEGGMSFHGGLLGVIIAGYIFAKREKISFLGGADVVMPWAALGLGLGRLGNFINAELFGSPTDLPWGVVFPGETIARHPSQLYEMFFEGVLMFFVLQFMVKHIKTEGIVFWAFFIFYGVARYLIEFIRLPDNIPSLYPNGLLYGVLPMSQGQFLSSLMIIAGVVGIIYIYRKQT
jgi:phosphatidylglycerol:prolipoprotein diacylglycerol transferase